MRFKSYTRRGGAALVRGCFALAVTVACLMWLTCTAATTPNEASRFTDVLGKSQQPLDIRGKAGSALIFYWHDCPICNSYVPEINRLQAEFTAFTFYLIEVDSDWSDAQARAHIQQFDIKEPVLLDRDHQLASLAGATVTPEVVVFGTNETVLYRGRIDNTYAGLGLRRPNATTHDLRDALKSILTGKPVTIRPPAVGCVIPNANSQN